MSIAELPRYRTSVQSVTTESDRSTKRSRWRHQLHEWKRTKILDKKFKEIGIRNPEQNLAEQLSDLSVDQLRELHFFTIPTKTLDSYQGIGSIGLTFTKSQSVQTITDVRESSYTRTLHPNDEFLQLHFTPFGLIEKQDGASFLQTLFLGGRDLIQVIDWMKEDPQNHPAVVCGYTNETLSRFIIKQLDFHPDKASIYNKLDKKRQLSTDDLKMLFPQDTHPLSPNEVKTTFDFHQNDYLWISSFMNAEDFFSEPMRKKVADMVEYVYRRISGDRSGEVTPQKLDEIEKIIRISAIEACMKNQPKYLRF